MQASDPSGQIVGSTFNVLRILVGFAIFLGAVAFSRWGVRKFILHRGTKSDRRRTRYASISVVALVLLVLLHGPAEKLLNDFGSVVSHLRPGSELDWVGLASVGIYYTLIATFIVLLALQAIAFVYWFFDKRVEAWQTRLHSSGKAIESNPRFHASRSLRVSIRLFRDVLVAALILLYFFYGFTVFPRTRIFSNILSRVLAPPLQDAVRELENYIPNLGYLFVILLSGWIILKVLKYLFSSIQNGTLVFERFPAEWADPTYKLSRSILFLFLLMVSFPYLPGANSAFFRGFSVFVGALVTFGSSGLIGDLLAGILLTYARAFRVGDIVRIEDVYGKVTEKTLLVTRVITKGNEYVTIPNSKVLADSVTNYSSHSLGKSVAVAVAVTIGYDVDWRTVHKLLIEGATRSEQISTDPGPQVLETSFGNYSVEYELRAWTTTSERVFEIHAALRRNVLDAFAEGGVEIMTPTILSHRDASTLAVPIERFSNRPQPQGIRVIVDPLMQSDDSGSH